MHSAHESFALISGEFRAAITETASDGTLTGRAARRMDLPTGAGELHLSAVEPVNGENWRNGTEPPFDVITATPHSR